MADRFDDSSPTQDLLEVLKPRRTFSDRHVDVLLAAMRLIAEGGLAAASLRELARRVGVSQPSLYHYFDSKEQLVEQIIEAYTTRIFAVPDQMPSLASLEDLVRYLMDFALGLYERDEYQQFVRFMFVISLERFEHGPTLRDRFLARSIHLFVLLLQPWVASGEILAADAERIAQAATGAMVLPLIEDTVMLRRPVEREQWASYRDFVVELVVAGARERARRAKEG